MEINYDKLIDDWSEKIFNEADKAFKTYEDTDIDKKPYKAGFCSGYSQGLKMAQVMLCRMESKTKKNIEELAKETLE